MLNSEYKALLLAQQQLSREILAELRRISVQLETKPGTTPNG